MSLPRLFGKCDFKEMMTTALGNVLENFMFLLKRFLALRCVHQFISVNKLST